MVEEIATSPSPHQIPNKTAKRVLILAICIALYAAIGFLVAPPFIRSQLESVLTEKLNHPVTVKEVRLNPFALSLTVLDFAISERNQTPLLGFEELYVNVELTSLVNRALTFSSIRLLRPFAVVIVRQDGTVNLADLHPPHHLPDIVCETPATSLCATINPNSGSTVRHTLVGEDRSCEY